MVYEFDFQRFRAYVQHKTPKLDRRSFKVGQSTFSVLPTAKPSRSALACGLTSMEYMIPL